MRRLIIITSVIMVVLTAIFISCYLFTEMDIFLTLAITFGTISYHFVMRLAVGAAVNAVMDNKADYTRKWYKTRKWEEKLFKLLNVKKWKGKVPTYSPETFDFSKRTPDEIAQAMCQAEIVHEIILILNYLPIIASIWASALPVFVITSLLSSVPELVFIITQRYNRPRIIRLIKRSDQRAADAKSAVQ